MHIVQLLDYHPDKQEDPDEHVKEAFTEIRQVVTGQGDEKGMLMFCVFL